MRIIGALRLLACLPFLSLLLAACAGAPSPAPGPGNSRVAVAGTPAANPAMEAGAREAGSQSAPAPGNAAARPSQVGSGTMPGSDGLTEADRLRFFEGVKSLENGDFVDAETTFDALVRTYPQRASFWANLGTARMSGGQVDGALAAYLKAVSLEAGLAAIHERLGVLYARRGETAQALAAYQAALKAEPNRARVHLNLGILYERDLGEPGRALKHYRRYQEVSLSSDPQVESWINQLE